MQKNDGTQVRYHTLYQVSTATALVEGIYQGAVRVGTLREHGDLGLGTFENLDGEMVIVDGQFFQVRCDGSVRECGDDLLSPFAVITPFAPDAVAMLDQCPDMGRLTSRFDALRNSDKKCGFRSVHDHATARFRCTVVCSSHRPGAGL